MSATRYKPGDKVMVRPDFHRAGGSSTYGIGVNDSMLQMKGKMLTIKKVDHTAYAVKENQWWWTDEMLVDLIQICEPFRDSNEDASSKCVEVTDIDFLKNLFAGE